MACNAGVLQRLHRLFDQLGQFLEPLDGPRTLGRLGDGFIEV